MMGSRSRLKISGWVIHLLSQVSTPPTTYSQTVPKGLFFHLSISTLSGVMGVEAPHDVVAPEFMERRGRAGPDRVHAVARVHAFLRRGAGRLRRRLHQGNRLHQ